MKPITRASLTAYILGILILPLGVAFMEKADFGVSMIVAPAYVLYRFLSNWLSFFTFGMAEYLVQAILLVFLLLILRKFRWSYLFSFITAVLYGIMLDIWMLPVQFISAEALWVRLLLYIAGLLVTALGVAFFFHTTIAPEVYELFVMEIAAAKGISVGKCKTIYDCSSCLMGIFLSFLCFGFGNFVGIRWGTIFCALVNGWLIARFSTIVGKFFDTSSV